MGKNSISYFMKICMLAFMIITVFVLVTLPWLLNLLNQSDFIFMTDYGYKVMLMVLYPAGIVALITIRQLYKLFLSLEKEDPFIKTNVRISLIKTLYRGIQYPEVRSIIEGIALANNQDINVRSAATRVLSTFPKGRQSRSALFNLVANSQYASIRATAAAGLKFEMTEEDVRWLSLPVDPRSGLVRDPFQN